LFKRCRKSGSLRRREQICSSIWDADEPEVDEAETACMRCLILDLDEKIGLFDMDKIKIKKR